MDAQNLFANSRVNITGKGKRHQLLGVQNIVTSM